MIETSVFNLYDNFQCLRFMMIRKGNCMAAVTGERGETIFRDGFATVTEAARFLRVSRAKLYLMMDAGDLVYAKFGKSRRIPWQAIYALVERSLVR